MDERRLLVLGCCMVAYPEQTISGASVIILYIPVQEYLEAFRVVQQALKQLMSIRLTHILVKNPTAANPRCFSLTSCRSNGPGAPHFY